MNLGTPWMLLLLPLVAIAGWLMMRAHCLQRQAACRLQGVAAENRPMRLARRDWLALAALVCIVLALARPQWNPRPYDVERRGRDLVIALDVSRSMLAADVFPSRLETARIAIHEALPAWSGQRIALITFAGSAAVRVPLTLDHEFVRYMLERTDPSNMVVGSTSLQSAVEKAVGTVLTDATRGGRDLVVFTDGEDHLSDVKKTANLLSECGARVLIVGLGDPVRGARVPSASGENQWMQYQDANVVSRLDESTLEKLAGTASNVTYYPARTRPFDLRTLYQQLISGAADNVVVGKMRQVRYTEGYPILLGLSVVLCLALSPWRKKKVGNHLPETGSPGASHKWFLTPFLLPLSLLVVLALLLPGCTRQADIDADAAFRAKCQRGGELLEYAEEQPDTDAVAQRSLLLKAREQFLLAALLQPGDVKTARRITAVTGRLHELEGAIEKQRAEEANRQETLAEIIQRLDHLSARQTSLAGQSTQLLARQIAAEPNIFEDTTTIEDNNKFEDNNDTTTASNNIDRRFTSQAVKEQQAVREGTGSVLENVTLQRDVLRQTLKQAFGIGSEPETEVDPIVNLLEEATTAQQQALASLAPKSIDWPRANTAFHTAAGRMQQALESLRALQPPSTDQENATIPAKNSSDYNEEMAAAASENNGNKSQPVPAGDFQTALSLQSLPVPNYTSADILAEEVANQKQRTKQRAASAGAKVEKNW